MDVHFFHFPKSGVVRDVVESRIRNCVKKFKNDIVTIRVYFSESSLAEHEMKIEIHGSGHFSGFVHAKAVDPAHVFEETLEKLEALLKKESEKHKHKKNEFSHAKEKSDYNVVNLRYKKRLGNQFSEENAFDKYENSFVSDFEDSEQKKKAS